jgi:hypothetical protein
VLFERDESRRYRAHVYRRDGVVLLLPGYDRKWRVPHDLAHFAVERALRMTSGVFGTIAAGGVFPNMRIVEGRARHDAARTSARVLRENSAQLGAAELLAGVVHDSVERRDRSVLVSRARGAWESVREEPFPYSPAQLSAAADALDELAARWTGPTFDVVWPQPPRDIRSTSKASSS